jgi:hypothetical protein
MKDKKNQASEQAILRAKLWREFVASYQVVLEKSPETFTVFCEKFREMWIAGR